MTAPFPLSWPRGQARSPYQRSAAFRHHGAAVPLAVAIRRLQAELDRLGAGNVVLTSDWPRNLDGSFSGRAPALTDPAVAAHFVAFGKATVLACDRWDRLPDNIAAIAAHIEALRGMDRWGVGSIEQAFAGYQALPAPEQWWQVLGCTQTTPLAQIEAVYRQLARKAHPDQGGTDAAMARLNAALAQARAAAR